MLNTNTNKKKSKTKILTVKIIYLCFIKIEDFFKTQHEENEMATQNLIKGSILNTEDALTTNNLNKIKFLNKLII